MALAGVNTGLAHTAVSALWAELYGVSHLGGIKSLVSSMMVFGTALGPVIMGGLMDLGYSIEAVCVLFAVYAGAGGVLMLRALRS
jgi:MFS family permease